MSHHSQERPKNCQHPKEWELFRVGTDTEWYARLMWCAHCGQTWDEYATRKQT